jgi:hypothetical protein
MSGSLAGHQPFPVHEADVRGMLDRGEALYLRVGSPLYQEAIGRRRMTPNRITQQHGFLKTLLKTMCTDLDLRELVT